jgi:hypothetical protein
MRMASPAFSRVEGRPLDCVGQKLSGPAALHHHQESAQGLNHPGGNITDALNSGHELGAGESWQATSRLLATR